MLHLVLYITTTCSYQNNTETVEE